MQRERLEELRKIFPSLMPIKGKNAFFSGWERWCEEIRPFKVSDFNGHNAGILCGPANGIIALDIDNFELFKATFQKKGWPLPSPTRTRVHKTSQGYHYFYQYPKDGKHYGNRVLDKKWGFGIKGNGGYVTAPGSIHPDTGKPYSVLVECDIAPAPGWLLKLALKEDEPAPKQDQASSWDGEVDSLQVPLGTKKLIREGEPKGKRSEAIMSVLNSLVSAGVSDSSIEAIFEKYPIGEKYREKGNSKKRWLRSEISRARKFASTPKSRLPEVIPSKPAKVEPKQSMQALSKIEDGDAWLYTRLHAGALCYDHASGDWYIFRGPHWMLDRKRQALKQMRAVIKVYVKEHSRQSGLAVKAVTDQDKKAQEDAEGKLELLGKRITELCRLKRKENVLELSTCGLSSLGIIGDEWDHHPYWLPVGNGVVDLKTGELMPGDPSFYIKTFTSTDYHGLDVPAPLWDRFIREILGDDSQRLYFLQRLLGMALVGQILEHAVPILDGSGANGKTTLMEVIGDVFGDLCTTVEPEMLLRQRYTKASGSPSPDLLALRGKRLVYGSEVREGRSFDTSKLKWLSGGDRLKARALHKNRYVQWDPTHTLVLETNHLPHAPDGDDFAFWRRILRIYLDQRFVDRPEKPGDHQKDGQIRKKLYAERSGVLAWMVNGCLAYQEQGLDPLESVRMATKKYQDAEDILGHWIEEKCWLEADEMKSSEGYTNYKEWAKESGFRPMTSTAWGTKMGKRFKKDKRRDATYYLGIALK